MGFITNKLESTIEEYGKALNLMQFISSISKDSPVAIARYLLSYKTECSLKSYTINEYYQVLNSEVNSDGKFLDSYKLLKVIESLWEDDESLSLHSFNYPELREFDKLYWKKEDFFGLDEFKDLHITVEAFDQFQLEYQPKLDIVGFTEKIHEQDLIDAPLKIVQMFNQDSYALDEASLFIPNYCHEQNKDIFEDEPNIHNMEIIKDFITRGHLTIESDRKILKENLKKFLSSIDIRIKGFNEDTESLESLKLSIENEKLKNEIEKLKLEINKLKAGTDNLSKDQKTSNIFDLIFDQSQEAIYAPDLVLAIKLWESIYLTSPKEDSHTNKANTWLKNNTGYDVTKQNSSASKIREITSPLKYWSTHRDKKFKK